MMQNNNRIASSRFSASALDLSYLIFVIGVVVIWNMPDVNARHFFQADDWAWLYNAEFHDFGDLFSLLPQSIYNDRPIGAIAIKAGYEIFGLNPSYFLLSQLGLHVVNCILLYLISKKYVGRSAALLAGVLAGTWVAANNAVFWTAAIFDILAVLLCLTSIWVWQLAWNCKVRIIYFIVGAVAYFLAIRTKEFAIGLPVLLFLVSTMLEKRSLSETLQSLVPYLAVMLVCGVTYLQLFYSGVSTAESSPNPYALDLFSVADNFVFYFSRAFYVQQVGPFGPIVAAIVFLAAGVRMPYYKTFVFVCFCGFSLMLGPTLLLGAHQDVLYLYAPHFFLALAIGSLFLLPAFWKAIALSVSVSLVVLPPDILGFSYLTNLYSKKTAEYREQFNSFLRAVGKIQSGSTIFIFGLETYMNPFSYGPGNSVKVAEKDSSLEFVIEKPRDVLIKEFCATQSSRYFIAFHGNDAWDETELASKSCDPAVSESPRR